MFQNGNTYSLLLLLLVMSCAPSAKKDATREDGYNDYEQDQPQEKPREGRTYTVEIKQMKFVPDRIVVHKGDKIVWINKDIVDHDVTEESSKVWGSSKLTANASWSMIATKNEIYYCSIHVVMKGKIVVDDQSVSDNRKILPDIETASITMCR